MSGNWGFIRLPYLADELEPVLIELESASDLGTRAQIIGAICERYRRALCDQGIFPDSKWRNFMGSFEIVDSIQDLRSNDLLKIILSDINICDRI